MLNVVDGCIPSDLATGTTAEIEEERRLLYVAMTRAKDHLHLIVPQRFYVRGSGPRRPPPLRAAHALHSGSLAGQIRALRVAKGRRGVCSGEACARAGRHRRAGTAKLGLMPRTLCLSPHAGRGRGGEATEGEGASPLS